MTYRNHCNTLATHHYTGGHSWPISALLADKSHTIEIWGNSRDGFEPYLMSGGSGVSISSGRYTLKRDLYFALRSKFGNLKFKAGRNWL